VHFAGGVEATSGLVGLLLLKTLCQEVSVFGIGGAASASTPYQYFTLFKTQRSEGKSTAKDAHTYTTNQCNKLQVPVR
jgi:hypothetical protein